MPPKKSSALSRPLPVGRDDVSGIDAAELELRPQPAAPAFRDEPAAGEILPRRVGPDEQMLHAPAPHLGDERRRRRFTDRAARRTCPRRRPAAKHVPYPAIPHLGVEPLAGDVRQQSLEVHVERCGRALSRGIAVHVAMWADLDQHRARHRTRRCDRSAAGRMHADPARDGPARTTSQRKGRSPRQARSPACACRRTAARSRRVPARPAAASCAGCDRTSPPPPRCSPEAAPGSGRPRRRRSPRASGRRERHDEKHRQPDVREAAVVVEPAVRQRENLDVVPDDTKNSGQLIGAPGS